MIQARLLERERSLSAKQSDLTRDKYLDKIVKYKLACLQKREFIFSKFPEYPLNKIQAYYLVLFI